MPSNAGFSLSDVVRFRIVQVERLAGGGLPLLPRGEAPAPPSAPSPAVEPARLPLGLARAWRTIPEPGVVELLYRNDAGLVILISQASADAPVAMTQIRHPVSSAGPNNSDAHVLDDDMSESLTAYFPTISRKVPGRMPELTKSR